MKSFKWLGLRGLRHERRGPALTESGSGAVSTTGLGSITLDPSEQKPNTSPEQEDLDSSMEEGNTMKA